MGPIGPGADDNFAGTTAPLELQLELFEVEAGAPPPPIPSGLGTLYPAEAAAAAGGERTPEVEVRCSY